MIAYSDIHFYYSVLKKKLMNHITLVGFRLNDKNTWQRVFPRVFIVKTKTIHAYAYPLYSVIRVSNCKIKVG